jgi:hypothetical protein
LAWFVASLHLDEDPLLFGSDQKSITTTTRTVGK